ncbi:MAG: hypothetical protein ACOCT9_00595 [archaeon]
MKWVAKYFNGEELHEKDKEGNENSFEDIEKLRVHKFGLKYDDLWFCFSTVDGNFSFNGKILGVGIVLNNDGLETVTKLSDRDDKRYSKLIQFKKAHIDFKSSGGVINKIDNYNFGYETKIRLPNGAKINFKPIVTIPTENKRPYIMIHLKSNKVFEGQLLIMYDDNPKRYPITFSRPHSEGKLKFIIK